MKKYIYLLLSTMALVLSGCSKDNDSSDPTTSVKVFPLNAVANSNISGKVTFTKNENGSTTVLLEINGASLDIHPAFIYLGDKTNPGAVAITLEYIDCDCESSSTVIKTMDDGTAITYEQLLKLDAHISIHQNADHLEIILAQGNIGANFN
ncbi:hypothetical protein KCTC52924_00599 [Arenibacter antarcticus]|uniref:CHRD domain-containing protein n=1 Tax=Arenibacter antarcticus TaxID=2040469 RepID=A0ABW5VBM2_9FLAO|nr:hypothetical protein [Arenibacter sp. H213]MCM4169335.1 hypothetical protein [Arenibacter sp. H213]